MAILANQQSPTFAAPLEVLVHCYRYSNQIDSCVFYEKLLLMLDTSLTRNVSKLLAEDYYLLNKEDSSDKYFNIYFSETNYKNNDKFKIKVANIISKMYEEYSVNYFVNKKTNMRIVFSI